MSISRSGGGSTKRPFPHQVMGGSLGSGNMQSVEGLQRTSSDVATLQRKPGSPESSAEEVEWVRMLQNFAVSSTAASFAHVPHHPLYTLKSQMMYRGRRFRMEKFLAQACESKGAFLMRGVVVRSIWIAPEKALKMAGWDAGVNFVNYAYPQCPKGLQWLFGGAMAGAGTTIIGCPSERIMVLRQVTGTSFWKAAVVYGGPMRALYHGAQATLLRDVSFNSCMFALRSYIMKWYEDKNGVEPGKYAKVLYGLPASVLAGVLACPFDVVKTRIQGTLELDDARNRRALLRMYQIAREEGVRSLYKGLVPRLIAVPMYMSVFIAVNEELQKWILGRRIVS